MKRSAARAARTAREHTFLYDVYLITTGRSRGLCAKLLRDNLPDCDLHDAITIVQKELPVIILTGVARRVGRRVQTQLLAIQARVSLQAKTPRGPVFMKRHEEYIVCNGNGSAPELVSVAEFTHTLECAVSTRLGNGHQGCGCPCHVEQETTDE